MFVSLRFITIFDTFILPNQVDLSAHYFYHFSASHVLILRCNSTLIILVWRFQRYFFKLSQFDKKNRFLRLHLTIKTNCYTSFTFLVVTMSCLDYHFVQSDLVGSGFLKALTMGYFRSNL